MQLLPPLPQLLMSWCSSLLCPQHNWQVSSVCLCKGCPVMPVCQSCMPQHQGHQDRLNPIATLPQELNKSVMKQIVDERTLDTSSRDLETEIQGFRGLLTEAEKELYSRIMLKFEDDKAEVVRNLRTARVEEAKRIDKYFGKLIAGNNLEHRIMFSSQEGLHEFYACYDKYCQANTIRNHLNHQQMQFLDDYQVREIQARSKLAIRSTLTSELMNFIKLKVSKRDAVRISEDSMLLSSYKKLKNMARPPLSPEKKRNPRHF